MSTAFIQEFEDASDKQSVSNDRLTQERSGTDHGDEGQSDNQSDPRLGEPKSFSYKSLSSMLRILGAGILVTSLSIFLFQGWAEGNDIYRFAILIGFSGVLAAAGLVSSHVIRENIGARLFLGIGLLSVVVNFAIAGGLIYSSFQPGQSMEVYPEFARWQVATGYSAALTVIAAIAVLAPVSLMGFRALARRSSTELVRLFLLANAALLVPFRDSEIVVLVVGTLTIYLLSRLAKARRVDSSLATMESRFAQAVVLAPMLVMIGRMVFLQSATAFVITSLSALIFVAFRQITIELKESTRVRNALENLSCVAAFSTAYGATEVVSNIWPQAGAALLPTFCLVFASLLIELSVRCAHHGSRLRGIATVLVAAGISTNLFLFPGALSALFCLGIGIGILVYGYSADQKSIFSAGLTTTLFGFAYQVWLATTLFEIGNWGALAILGTLAILLASVLERYGLQIRRRVGLWRSEINAWDT